MFKMKCLTKTGRKNKGILALEVTPAGRVYGGMFLGIVKRNINDTELKCVHVRSYNLIFSGCFFSVGTWIAHPWLLLQ